MHRLPGRSIRLVLGAALLLGAGCATAPAPRPHPASLPEAVQWIGALGARPCAGPFRAHLKLRIQSQKGRPLGVDGTLSTAPPDTLRLAARIGPFRPLFALLAGADSCQLLIHHEACYWICPRNDPDWERMDPSAWATALGWALCPASLLSRFRPDAPPREADGLVWFEGSLSEGAQDGGAGLRLRAGLDPGSGRLREFQIIGGGPVLLLGTLNRYRKVAGGELPTSFEVAVPKLKWSLHAELRDLRSLPDRDAFRGRFPRPQGWRRVEGMSLPEFSGEAEDGQPN